MPETTTSTSCADCSAVWPDAPKRPSLVGGCSGCRREYKRRYNAQDHVVRQRKGNQRDHKDRRAREAAEKYHREGLRFKKYGLTKIDFEQMLEQQGHACAICRRATSSSKAHIDHDHETGRVRGLLCGPCNRGLGLFQDSSEALQSALDYLNKEK